MSPYQNILVVCQGNICRSPVAEAMLRQHLPERKVQSAGLGAMVGQGVESYAAEFATDAGFDVSTHKARQIDAELVQWADLILVMSQRQRTELGEKWPSALGKTMLLGHWVKNSDASASLNSDIPDPYRKSREVFQHVHQAMDQATMLWSQKI